MNPRDTDREDLGAYPSLEAFARDVVTPLLRPEGLWLRDCLDLARVLAALAGDDHLQLERGHVWLDRRTRE
jgi:hypothetical protein